MEAVAALGLAGNAVQLLQTVTTIVCTVREVVQFVIWPLWQREAIRARCSTLRDLCGRLRAADHVHKDTELSGHDEDFLKLAFECKEKFHQLVKYTDKFAVTRNGKLKWMNAIQVSVLIWRFQPDIKNLEEEIYKIQISMLLLTSSNTG